LNHWTRSITPGLAALALLGAACATAPVSRTNDDPADATLGRPAAEPRTRPAANPPTRAQAPAGLTPPPGATARALGDVSLQTLDGQVTDLRAALGGRVALVALWATWCKTCKGELAALARLSERAAAQGATVLGVAVGETRDTVAAFVARRGLPYLQLVDEEYRLAQAIGSDRIPTTLVLDRDGHIIYQGGLLDDQALAALRSELKRAAARR
jgi:cytochrome c biogenesis protein CcmG, thiol:disulfide interchange protein DsbE